MAWSNRSEEGRSSRDHTALLLTGKQSLPYPSHIHSLTGDAFLSPTLTDTPIFTMSCTSKVEHSQASKGQKPSVTKRDRKAPFTKKDKSKCLQRLFFASVNSL
jgi:hypothetical protein